MANFTAADVKKLRELTGAGMMDCKKALDEADGDVDKAVEILRVKGQKGVAKREGRAASNGAVVSLIADGQLAGVLLELNCETDFVAKGDKFVAVADAIAAPRRRHRPGRPRRAARLRDRGRQDRPGVRRRGQRHPRREDRAATASRSSPAASSPPTCTAPARTCPRRSASWSSWTRRTPRSPRTSRSTSPRSRPKYLTRDEVPADDGRERASRRRGHRARGGQARGRPAEDRRGSGQRLLQGERPPRAGVRQGQQEDRPEGARRGRRHAEALRALPRRRLSPANDRRPG